MTAADRATALTEALRKHHPIMRSETGPFSGCRCGGVRLGQDVIAHVLDALLPVVDRLCREAAAEALREPTALADAALAVVRGNGGERHAR